MGNDPRKVSSTASQPDSVRSSSTAFDVSSCTSSEFASPLPSSERISPYGQDEDEEDLSVTYKKKRKMMLLNCLPFARKRKHRSKLKKMDSEPSGADC